MDFLYVFYLLVLAAALGGLVGLCARLERPA